MSNIQIPDILTDLAHVGTAGLLLGEAPAARKELETCREWGYRIGQEDDRIVLLFDEEQIVPYWIQREVPDLAWEGLRVNGFLELDSTNREALDQARMGALGGTLVCAERQTAGRGRQNRFWHSPANTGLYFSLIVRPEMPEKYWPLLTHAASVALFRTFEDLADTELVSGSLNPEIKWPNDLLLSGKKCAGILLESLAAPGNQAVVVGVGVNVHRGSVPEELSDTAVCLDETAGVVLPRRKILVGFLQHFQLLYVALEKGRYTEVLESWKRCSSMWNGVRIWIEEDGRRRPAVTCGIDEIGALVVRNEDGLTETLLAGDVRIRRDD